jgi:hypothetical protein
LLAAVPTTPFTTPVLAVDCPNTADTPVTLLLEVPVIAVAVPVTLMPPLAWVMFEFPNDVLPVQTGILPFVPLPVTWAWGLKKVHRQNQRHCYERGSCVHCGAPFAHSVQSDQMWSEWGGTAHLAVTWT